MPLVMPLFFAVVSSRACEDRFQMDSVYRGADLHAVPRVCRIWGFDSRYRTRIQVFHYLLQSFRRHLVHCASVRWNRPVGGASYNRAE